MAELTPLERALRILLRLSTHDRVTVSDLHELFDKRESTRSIQRTLDAIQNANIPLQVERGPHNTFYYSLHRGFDYLPQLLEPDEILAALLLAPFFEMFSGTRIGQDLKTLFAKIDHLVPSGSVGMTTALQGLQDIVKIHQPGRVDREGLEALRPLFRAILERREVQVTYCARDSEPKTYDVHPYSLLFHQGSIYTIVFQPKHSNFIYLALHRIQAMKLGEHTFPRDPSFSLEEFLANNFGVWQAEPEAIRLRFDKVVAHTIRERTWHHSQQLEEREDGHLDLCLTIGVTEELIAWILRWGEYVEVLEPKTLRAEMRERLARIRKRYDRANNT